MTLDEAIKRLQVVKEGWPLSDSENYYKAVELGIEAFKRLQDIRHTIYSDLQSPLPGETE